MASQALAVVGAFVGGWLARQRRLEVEKTNHKLRRINNELRKRQQDVSCLKYSHMAVHMHTLVH